MKKTKKGTYGYIRNERKRRLLITLASFAIPLIIYVTGYIQTKTRLNLFTFGDSRMHSGCTGDGELHYDRDAEAVFTEEL